VITDVDDLYFKWLMDQMGNPDDHLVRLCWMLHNNAFTRNVGNDVNRATEGIRLRHRFASDMIDANIDPRKMNLMMLDEHCSWFEMLFALSEALDYLYEGGVQDRLLELVDNMGLSIVLTSPLNGRYDELDQEIVDTATTRVDNNLFEPNGYGGLFPLQSSDHPDQREVEIWVQHAAYFREKLEGVVWTSIS
jgi:hypothetical protein